MSNEKVKINFTEKTNEQAQDILGEMAQLFQNLGDDIGAKELVHCLKEAVNNRWRADEVLMVMVHVLSLSLSASYQANTVIQNLEQSQNTSTSNILLDDDDTNYTLN